MTRLRKNVSRFCGLVCLLAGFAAPATAETRTFVVGWFSQATYSQDGDCPGGVNPDISRQYVRNAHLMGFTKEQIAAFGKGKGLPDSLRSLMNTRARIDGKPANPYSYPSAVVDPKLNAVSARYAYGFDLDGAAGPKSFEDPETHETGVDNELARALGCMRSFRGSLASRPTYWAWAWGQLKDSQPAWLITLSAPDFTKDGPVTITFDRALEHLRSNADGSPRADASYRIDPDPRSHNVLQGHIKGGVISLDQPGALHLLQNPLVAPEFKLSKVKMRLSLRPDGTLSGIIGGYQPWADLYFGFAAGGPTMEVCITGDIPGLYYLLKKHADADPDPTTGQNASISAAYYLESVPVFAVDAKQTVTN
ncbi:MAG: hypothetical protein K1X51_05750 [Rhodospirillaceae bacterium]|nr:hypothetical protein [Rhodospirillaceae bacterium]